MNVDWSKFNRDLLGRCRPRCYNHIQFSGSWVCVHRPLLGKPHYRWRSFPFEQRCAAWDAPDGSKPVPEREGWLCNGCHWEPERSKRVAPLAQLIDVLMDAEPSFLNTFTAIVMGEKGLKRKTIGPRERIWDKPVTREPKLWPDETDIQEAIHQHPGDRL